MASNIIWQCAVMRDCCLLLQYTSGRLHRVCGGGSGVQGEAINWVFTRPARDTRSLARR